MRRLLLAIALVALGAPAVGRAQGAVAVVVHPANRLGELSSDKLRRLYLGQTRTFPTGEHARLGRYTPLGPVFDRAALKLQPEIVRSRWMAMIFRGESTAIPAELRTADEVRAFVRAHPDAIAFLPSEQVSDGLKVIAIDGKRPNDAGYVIH